MGRCRSSECPAAGAVDVGVGDQRLAQASERGGTMDAKLFVTVFVTVFLAEIADKTQVATVLYATQSGNDKVTVFLGSAIALVIASAIAVFAGAMFSHWLNPRYVSWVAGGAFILVGIWVLVSK
jgi:putative Ca2+/H+ antiporter (TMEM165/GDT1 family)